MSDDRLREVADRAASAARLLDFDSLAARGRRRRRTATAASFGASALVLGLVFAGTHAVYDDQSAPVRPAHHTPRTTAPSSPPPTGSRHAPLQPEQIVHNPNAEIEDLALSSDDLDVRATSWQVPLKDGRSAWAIAVSSNAFGSASYLRVEPYSGLTWVGADNFAATLPGGALVTVTPDGSIHRLQVSAHPSALHPGETLVPVPDGKGPSFYAVDLPQGTAHPVSLPAGVANVENMLQHGSALIGLGGVANILVSSPDGGRTWRAPVHLSKQWLYQFVDSDDPNVLAAIEVGEDGVSYPSSFVQTTDSGQNWQTIHPPMPNLQADWAAVTPAGRLLVAVEAERDARRIQLVPRGEFISTDSSWTAFRQVLPGGAHPDYPLGYLIEDLDASSGQILYVAHGNAVFASSNEGRSWQPARAR
jgi:hypothetical protein